MASPELLGESAPPIELVVAAWLAPWDRGTRRLSGDPVPYRLISAVAGVDDPETGLVEWTVSVHTFANGAEAAVREADKTHRRMMQLARNPLAEITVNGQFVNVDYCRTVMLPTEIEYGDPKVVRYVARYDIGLAYSPVS